MLALHHDFGCLDLPTGKVQMVASVSGLPARIRFNDGKCDPAGRLWAGTMELQGEPEMGALYRLDPDRRVHQILDRVTISNGLAWSHDRRRMYYIDTPTFTIDAFDYDLTTGHITNRRVAATVPKDFGYPDGMTIDGEDMLWVAHFGGGRVTRWKPATGQLLDQIRVPTKNVTSCAFGGAKLDQLYITTARVALQPSELANEPQAGGLFIVEPGVTGRETFEFAG
jgi:sugar lactone lactonase YvrE